MSDEITGQSPAATTAPAAVQPTTTPDPKQIHAYREIQSERDAAIAKASTLEEYEKLTPRLQDQVERQKKTIAQLEAEKKVSKLVQENPHLAKLAALQDFSGKTDEEINAWGKAATETLNSMVPTTTTQTAPTGQEAPNVQPVSAAATSGGQLMTPEALAKLPVDQQRAYLVANGIIKS